METQVIQTSLDINETLSSLQELVNTISNSLRKIDRLTQEVGSDISNNLVPVKNIKGKLKELERESAITANKLKDALKIKASVDTKSLQEASTAISQSTTGVSSTLEVINSEFVNLDNVLASSVKGLDILNSAMLASNTAGINYTKMALANVAANSALGNSYTETVAKVNIYDSSYQDLVNTARGYQRAINEIKNKGDFGLFTDEELTKIANYKEAIRSVQYQILNLRFNNDLTSKTISGLGKNIDRAKNSTVTALNAMKGMGGIFGQLNTVVISTVSSLGKLPAVMSAIASSPLLVALPLMALAWSTISDNVKAYDYYLNNSVEGNERQVYLAERTNAIAAKYNDILRERNSIFFSMREKFDNLKEFIIEDFFGEFSILGYAVDALMGGSTKFSKEVLDSRKKAKEEAKATADVINTANKEELKLIQERAKAEAEVSKQRAIVADVDNKSASERKEAAKEVQRLQDEQLDREIELATLRRDAIKMQNDYGSSGLEDLKKFEEAEALLISLQAKRDENARQYLITLRSIARTSKEITEIDYSMMSTPRLFSDDNFKLIDTEELSHQIDDMVDAIYKSLDASLLDKMNQQTAITEGTSVVDMIFGNEEKRNQLYESLEVRRLQDVISANYAILENTATTEEEKTRIVQENAQARATIAEIELSQRQRMAQGLQGILTDLQSAFDQNTIAYKASASADVIISGIKGAQDAYSSLAPIPIVGVGMGIAAASASILASTKRVKDIWAVKKGQKNIPDASQSAQSVQSPLIKPSETFMSSSDIELQKNLQTDNRVYVVYDDIREVGNRVNVVNNESLI